MGNENVGFRCQALIFSSVPSIAVRSMDKTFEIRDGEIDIDKIVRRIEENISKRYANDHIDLLDLRENARARKSNSGNVNHLDGDLEFILNNRDIHNRNYSISSHRPLLGPALVKGRNLVHGEVRRYVDPVIDRQVLLNSCIYNTLMSQHDRINDLAVELAELKSKGSTPVRDNANKIKALEVRIAELSRQISEINCEMKTDIMDQVGARLDAWRRENANLGPQEGHSEFGAFHNSAFADDIGMAWNRIGGHSVDDPNVFRDAVELFRNCANVLDVGCGKGYFLKLLEESGSSGHGIDTDESNVSYCTQQGLKVHRTEALAYLRSLSDGSLDGIYIGHMVEHLYACDLVELLALCHAKLKTGSCIVIVTPNVSSMLVSANLFYLDPTHKNHIHPEVLRFLLRSSGFTGLDERFYQPVPEDTRLQLIDAGDENLDERSRAIVKVLNANFGRINDLVFGFRDYAVFASK